MTSRSVRIELDEDGGSGFRCDVEVFHSSGRSREAQCIEVVTGTVYICILRYKYVDLVKEGGCKVSLVSVHR